MEPLFELRYTRDKAMFREYFRRIQLLSPIYIFAYLYCAYCLLSFVLWWVLFGDCTLTYLIAPTALLGFLWYLQYRNISITLKQDLEINHGSPVEQYLAVYENRITGSVSTSSADVSFENIKKLRQSRNLIILQTKAKQAFVFPKAAFTRGTPEEFLAFLKTKGIQ